MRAQQHTTPIMTRVGRTAGQLIRLGPCAAAMLTLVLSSSLTSEGAATSTRILPSGDGIELVEDGPEGWYKEVIPLHRSGDVGYFSTGTGLEERNATYPPFPLKLIFVAGNKPYLARVAVTVTNAAGTIHLDIPKEHVNGPWLFLDLPDGTYNISADLDGRTQERSGIAVRSGSERVLYLRWEGVEVY